MTLQTEERRGRNGSSPAAERVAEVAERAEERNDCIERLNERHAVVRLGAKTVILDEQPGQPAVFMKSEDFHLWYRNRKVRNGEGIVAISTLWINHQRRREYECVVFDPRDTNPNHYNFWQGFVVKPGASKSCKKFLHHLKYNYLQWQSRSLPLGDRLSRAHGAET
jgi:hypothetical protein